MIKKIPEYRFCAVFVFMFAVFIPHQLCARTYSKTDKNIQNEQVLNFAYFEQKDFSIRRIVFSNHPLIEKFKTKYLTPNGLDYLAKVMQRSVLYRDFILEQLEVNSMPIELLFLPVIESGFNTAAVSRSGAVGVWQFMRNSVGGYNIHISEWVDERHDPWKTSIAAIKKLKYNYEVLGDWCLALAAYNAGLNAILQAIRKAGGRKDFWYLVARGYLKKETALYVPKFLAICEILMQSSELGIDWGNREEVLTTATVQIKRPVDINLVEKALSLQPGILRFLNPSLKYAITPPDHSYDLRLPSEYSTAFENLLASGTLLMHYYLYEVKSGDTLYALANHYGVSVNSIIAANKKVNARSLKIGQKLVIPALRKVSPYKKEEKSTSDFSSKYIVKKGDTLWSISLAHNTTVEELATANNLSIDSVLSIGKILLVP